MHTLALCSAEYERWVRRAAGVEPLLSPPVLLDTLRPSTLEGYDLLYIKLYGLAGEPFWFNRRGEVVISAALLRETDLSDTVVFVANCYLPESPMLVALLDAGARAVIGGAGYNYFHKSRLEGVDLLGLYVRYLLQWGIQPRTALSLAKTRLRFKRKDKVTKDTLSFQIWRQNNAMS